MATKKSQEKSSHPGESDQPKHNQLVRMLSFRIVPAYYKKIEKVADKHDTTVSALIRKYIKEGMTRDLESDVTQTSDFRIE
jgi:hypothetical protein